MAKISDLMLSADLLNQSTSLQNLGGTSGKVGASLESEAALDQNDSLPQSSDVNANIKMNLPLDGELLRHKLQSFDRPHDKAEHKNQESAENLTLENGGAEQPQTPRTALRVVHHGLMKHAADAGLPINEQKEFAHQHTKNFEQTAKAAGAGELLEKGGDLSLLSDNSAAVKVKVNGNSLNVKLGGEAEADLRQRLSKNGLSYKGNSELQIKLPSSSAGANVQTSSQTQVNIFGQTNTQNMQLAQLRANHQALNNLMLVSRREIADLRTEIEERVRNILRDIGIFEDENPEEDSSEGQHAEQPMPEELHEVAQYFDGDGANPEDNALFASALGIAGNSAGESRALHGDGLLLEFANYAGSTDKISFESTILDLVQNGSGAGITALLDAAVVNLSQSAIDALAEISNDLGADSTSDLVVGVVAMSVMTREVVERLEHVLHNPSLGLSDDALAALQKAQNSLRDCLTANDIIGAVGDTKGAPISIAGNHYNFLPEVREAINVLREARQKVVGELTGASGVESQQRFAVEAGALFKIASNIEKMIKA